jgi:subtilisin family serine protease
LLLTGCIIVAAAVALLLRFSPAAADPVPASETPTYGHVSISPESVSLDTAESAQFTAILYDSNGRAVTGVDATWSALPEAGSISSTGRFYATGKPGLYHGAVQATMAGLSATADVQIVHVRLFFPCVLRGYASKRLPNDPLYPQQWAYAHINAPQAWYTTVGDGGPIVAVLDTGVDLTHPDLAANLVPGATFVSANDNCPAPPSSPSDDNGHGTHVAGIVAAVGDNGVGVAGMNWHARLMPVKVLDCKGSGGSLEVAEGIRYAVDHGARVINMSLGMSCPQDSKEQCPPGLLTDAVAYAVSKGVVVVAASGNLGSGATPGAAFWPAAYPGVIGVGATDSSDKVTSFSNYGYFVDVVAPGYSILSTYPRSLNAVGYAYESGTSMSTPFVSGLAALLLSVNPSLSTTDVTNDILLSARDLGTPGWDPAYGYGLIDAGAALRRLAQVGATAEVMAAATPAETRAPAGNTPPAPGTYRPGELLVQLKPGHSELGLSHALSAMSLSAAVSKTSLSDVVRLHVPAGRELEYMRRLQGQADVQAVYLDVLLFAQ